MIWHWIFDKIIFGLKKGIHDSKHLKNLGMTTIRVMAGSMSAPPSCLCLSTSSASSRLTIFNLSSTLVSSPKTSTFHLSRLAPPLGLGHFSPWSDLKRLGILVVPKSLKSGTFFQSSFVCSGELDMFFFSWIVVSRTHCEFISGICIILMCRLYS